MHRLLRSIMATASLSALLHREAAASRSLFASVARTRRGTAAINSSSGLAFQSHQTFVRPPPIATAFANNGAVTSSSRVPSSRTLSTSTYRRAASSTSQVEGARPEAKSPKKPIPTILLAGFLGSGKTSTLKHLLENNSNIKIGTIVNDVASVNIDAKLISNSGSINSGDNLDSYAEGVVELQNGCACCSLADELFTSVERLTRGGERELDAIVVELSGVADPVAVRDNWNQAKLVRYYCILYCFCC